MIEIFNILDWIISKSSAADLLYVGKGNSNDISVSARLGRNL